MELCEAVRVAVRLLLIYVKRPRRVKQVQIIERSATDWREKRAPSSSCSFQSGGGSARDLRVQTAGHHGQDHGSGERTSQRRQPAAPRRHQNVSRGGPAGKVIDARWQTQALTSHGPPLLARSEERRV